MPQSVPPPSGLRRSQRAAGKRSLKPVKTTGHLIPDAPRRSPGISIRRLLRQCGRSLNAAWQVLHDLGEGRFPQGSLREAPGQGATRSAAQRTARSVVSPRQPLRRASLAGASLGGASQGRSPRQRKPDPASPVHSARFPQPCVNPSGSRPQPGKRQTVPRSTARPASKPVRPRRSDPTSHPSAARMLVVWGVLTLGAVGLTANLFRLQVLQAEVLSSRAQAQQTVRLQPILPRRPIVDRRGTSLAVDRLVYMLYAHPKLFKKSKDEVAEAIAPILNQPSVELANLFDQQESGIEISFGLSEDAADRIRALRLDGLELLPRQQRFYPQQDLLAEVVGYVNLDREAQAGVEYTQRAALERSNQVARFLRGGKDLVKPGEIPSYVLKQDDLRLQLTVDRRLQQAARTALKQKMTEFGAKRGAVLVMEVQTGALRVMATEPSFDPNQYYTYPMDQLRNWLLTDPYEPGSTFKPINVAIALEAGTVRPNDSFYDEGRIYIGPWPIQNSDGAARGSQTVGEIVAHSSNVGMVRIMQTLKPEIYYDWLAKIELAKPTGIDLPFETAGQLKKRDQFLGDPVEVAVTAFGQGFSLTPVQLLRLHGAIANGGFLVTPHVVEGLFDSSGKPHWQPQYAPPKQVFSRETAQAVLGMMEKAVEEGTGTPAQIPGYRIAGKTGTAQKASATGGYDNVARVTSFVSLFPVEAPRYAVLVVIDEPQGDNAYGSTVAAPIARDVMEALIRIDLISPSKAPDTTVVEE
ncbi:peptidoglycan D,D-transpeptidase FtsI family protein [Leptolyngbya sp. O-77]|uniref:peptidoglycan D,D-transpeptidase FtsI family protein n=1 Tax=Leptolyngbya sp. O-77 TaxID=1080068 RepID=UPI0009FFC964|nr:penicillin-binding transpeptidase domain-containing protein [Leptolyngbya sp. O-77]